MAENIIQQNTSENKITFDNINTNILFLAAGKDNQEILSLHYNGDIFVHGKLIENDKQVVDAFREFLRTHGFNC